MALEICRQPFDIHENGLNNLSERLKRNWLQKLESSDTADDSLTSLTWLYTMHPVDFSIENVYPKKVADLRSFTRAEVHSSPCKSSGQNLVGSLLDPQVRFEYRTKWTGKPPFSYATLICLAMRELGKPKVTLSDIYSWIMNNFAYYRHTDSSWQNSVRHNLSLNKCFEKVPRDKNERGKGGFWRVNPKHLDWLEANLAKCRRAAPPPGPPPPMPRSMYLQQDQQIQQAKHLAYQQPPQNIVLPQLTSSSIHQYLAPTTSSVLIPNNSIQSTPKLITTLSPSSFSTMSPLSTSPASFHSSPSPVGGFGRILSQSVLAGSITATDGKLLPRSVTKESTDLSYTRIFHPFESHQNQPHQPTLTRRRKSPVTTHSSVSYDDFNATQDLNRKDHASHTNEPSLRHNSTAISSPLDWHSSDKLTKSHLPVGKKLMERSLHTMWNARVYRQAQPSIKSTGSTHALSVIHRPTTRSSSEPSRMTSGRKSSATYVNEKKRLSRLQINGTSLAKLGSVSSYEHPSKWRILTVDGKQLQSSDDSHQLLEDLSQTSLSPLMENVEADNGTSWTTMENEYAHYSSRSSIINKIPSSNAQKFKSNMQDWDQALISTSLFMPVNPEEQIQVSSSSVCTSSGSTNSGWSANSHSDGHLYHSLSPMRQSSPAHVETQFYRDVDLENNCTGSVHLSRLYPTSHEAAMYLGTHADQQRMPKWASVFLSPGRDQEWYSNNLGLQSEQNTLDLFDQLTCEHAQQISKFPNDLKQGCNPSMSSTSDCSLECTESASELELQSTPSDQPPANSLLDGLEFDSNELDFGGIDGLIEASGPIPLDLDFTLTACPAICPERTSTTPALKSDTILSPNLWSSSRMSNVITDELLNSDWLASMHSQPVDTLSEFDVEMGSIETRNQDFNRLYTPPID